MYTEGLISVIVPIYKVEKYIEKCIKSLTCQSYNKLEIILVDDGSPDRCPEICDKYAAADSRIHVVHKENGGVSTARNAGLAVADGEYISFIDPDDFIEADFYEKMLSAVNEYDSDLVTCNFYLYYDKDTELPKDRLNDKSVEEAEDGLRFRPGTSITDLQVLEQKPEILKMFNINRHNVNVSLCNKFYRHTLFEEIKFPEGKVSEDQAVIYNLGLRCRKMAVLCDYLYYYRQRTTGLMGTSGIKHTDDVDAAIHVCNLIAAECPEILQNAVQALKTIYYWNRSMLSKQRYTGADRIRLKACDRNYSECFKKYSRNISGKDRFMMAFPDFYFWTKRNFVK